jgi:hypothetical protein
VISIIHRVFFSALIIACTLNVIMISMVTPDKHFVDCVSVLVSCFSKTLN